MVKGNPKTSATSATRKKHSKKNAPPEESVQNSKDNNRKSLKGGKKSKEPRVKMYIPPVKPAPIQPDPLEATGLLHTLPADLLVVLRSLSKRAQVTKVRALEELQAGWVEKCVRDRDEGLVYTLVEMLPVWVSSFRGILKLKYLMESLASPFALTACEFFSSCSTRRCIFAILFAANCACARPDLAFPSRNCIFISSGEYLRHLVSCFSRCRSFGCYYRFQNI